MSRPVYLPNNKDAFPLILMKKFYSWYIKTVKTFGSSTKRINTLWIIGYDFKTLKNVQARIEAVFGSVSTKLSEETVSTEAE